MFRRRVEFLDTSHIEWHIVRGLPVDKKMRKGLLVMSHREKVEPKATYLSKIYKQEYHDFGVDSYARVKFPKLWWHSPLSFPLFVREEDQVNKSIDIISVATN